MSERQGARKQARERDKREARWLEKLRPLDRCRSVMTDANELRRAWRRLPGRPVPAVLLDPRAAVAPERRLVPARPPFRWPMREL
jgi:hypothetical protein